MSEREVQRAQARFRSLVARQGGRIDRLSKDFADSLSGLTPADLRRVIDGASKREAARFLAVLRESIAVAKRQGAFLGARVGSLGDKAAARWLTANAETVSARFAAHIHTQGRQMTRDLLRSVAGVIREGKSATEAARLLRDALGHKPAVTISRVAGDVVDSARRMIQEVGDEDLIRTYSGDLAKMKAHARRLGTLHDSSGKLAYGLRSSAQHLVGELERAVKRGRLDLVDRAVYYHGYDKRAYHQRMIARTTMSESYHAAYLETTEDAPEVIGHRWMLSTKRRQPRPDICDVHAAHDGGKKLGRGGFAKGKQPEMPAHPHCMCYWLPVVDESVEA